MQQRELLLPERAALGASAAAGPLIVAAIAAAGGGLLRRPPLPLGLLVEAQHHVGQAHLVARGGGGLRDNHSRRSFPRDQAPCAALGSLIAASSVAAACCFPPVFISGDVWGTWRGGTGWRGSCGPRVERIEAISETGTAQVGWNGFENSTDPRRVIAC
jgi:hypothetical protein